MSSAYTKIGAIGILGLQAGEDVNDDPDTYDAVLDLTDRISVYILSGKS